MAKRSPSTWRATSPPRSGYEPLTGLSCRPTCQVTVWLPTIGSVTAEPLPGGWLLRLSDTATTNSTQLELDLGGVPRVTVTGGSGTWAQTLTPRHAEILFALVEAGPAGRSAAGLAEDLFGE